MPSSPEYASTAEGHHSVGFSMPGYAEHMQRKRAFLKVLEYALCYDIQVLGTGDESYYK